MLMHTSEARLAALRGELVRRGLEGFVVPLTDEHLSEYVGAYAQRLAWLTGFRGSAGSAVVLRERAAVFVDGRYTLQVRDEVDGRLFEYQSVPAKSVAAWLGEAIEAGARIGYDPWLHTGAWVRQVTAALDKVGAELVAVDTNPVDAVWADRPAPSDSALFVQPEALAGRSAADKLADVAGWLGQQGADAVVITALDSVAWLFNVRGADVARTPVGLAFAVVHADGRAELFVDPDKVPNEVAAALPERVRLAPRGAFAGALGQFGGQRVAVDPERTVAAIGAALGAAGAHVVDTTDPVVLPKACKNAVELAGHRAAQVRDGAALVRFLAWLEATAPGGEVDELGAAARLEAERRATGALVDLSFDTISGAGPNGAIVHYRVEEATNRRLEPGGVYLVDSGGQYADGTTDVTRTVWIGPGVAPDEVRDRFTRVLKGHIALATAVFPRGTSGAALDSFARQFLWAAGLDYAHGTGHGVGAFLSVHEGPQRIAKAVGGQAGTGQGLVPGMIVSNEPGYYKTGAYGIRIENLVLVEPREIAGAEGAFCGFETLTLAPIDRALIAVDLLTPAERVWLDAYHATVVERLAPLLDDATAAWLAAACAPV